jgi:hypothetical protein
MGIDADEQTATISRYAFEFFRALILLSTLPNVIGKDTSVGSRSQSGASGTGIQYL